MKKESNMKGLFVEELKDMLSAEEQIVKALPSMVKAADSADLKDAFKTHLQQTKNHVERLKRIFSMMSVREKPETCEAMKGLIEECEEMIKNYPASAVRDAALISKAQRIEHYEISAYGTMRAMAKELGLEDAENLLQDTLDEEANADKLLTKIAEGSMLTSGINRQANEE